MISNGRLLDRLAVSRAFGDFEFKLCEDIDNKIIRKHFLTSEPEIRMVEIDPFIDDFIVLASDGLFDKFTSEECVSYIRAKMGNNGAIMEHDLHKIAKDICNEAIYGRHVRDNVTVIIVGLNRGIKLI